MSCGSAIGYVKSYIISSFCLSIINISLKAKGKFRCFFFITQFPLLITHHFKIPYPFGTITHLPSLNIFNTVYGPHICHSMQPFFFPIPKLTEPKKKEKKWTQWKKKKKKERKKERTQPMENSERRRKKKRKRKKEPNQRRQWRRKKKKWSKVAANLDSGSLYVCLITKMPLKTELWKLKTVKCIFSFHNS